MWPCTLPTNAKRTPLNGTQKPDREERSPNDTSGDICESPSPFCFAGLPRGHLVPRVMPKTGQICVVGRAWILRGSFRQKRILGEEPSFSIFLPFLQNVSFDFSFCLLCPIYKLLFYKDFQGKIKQKIATAKQGVFAVLQKKEIIAVTFRSGVGVLRRVRRRREYGAQAND